MSTDVPRWRRGAAAWQRAATALATAVLARAGRAARTAPMAPASPTARMAAALGSATVLAAAAALAGPAALAAEPAPTTAVAAPGLLDFSADERRRILRHGPWPPPPPRDPGNAQAGRPAAIALGRQLFFDARLSPDGRFACASCHQPALAFADGRVRALGRAGPGRAPAPDLDPAAGADLDRHSPSLWNAGHQRWQGWDGAFDSLWSQALQPLRAPRELAGGAAQLDRLLRSDAELACRVRQVVGAGAATPEARLVGAAKALGAFVATLVSGRTPFDAFRDALARGDLRSAARYPLAAQRGLRLFVGRARCSNCHVGPLFSNGEFADIGLPFFVRPGVVDPGRHAGILALQASRHSLLSDWADRDASPERSAQTRHVALQLRNFGEFKVPGLRNVADTAPYMHDGQLATLAAVLRHYATLSPDRLHADGEQLLQALDLDAGEQADLLAFLHSLSDPQAGRWRPAPLPRCQTGR